MVQGEFNHIAHASYFARFLQGVPEHYQGHDSNRLTIAYFAVSALDILNALDQVPCSEVIEWVYSLQILPSKDDKSSDLKFGFNGASLKTAEGNFSSYDGGHLAATYSAIAILRILGDDFSRVCKNSVLQSVRMLQQPDGCFTSIHIGTETDLRFVFCAAAICTFLEDWRGMDVTSAYDYIVRCQSYDGGFGLCPGRESHGGATYCAVASLKLMSTSGLVHADLDCQPLETEDWCLQRQKFCGGFQGRINKLADPCYAFWIGASLDMLGSYDKCDREELRESLLSYQNEIGGFSKYEGFRPDLFHSYYGLCGLSLLNESGLNALCCELGISQRAAKGLGLCNHLTAN